MKKKQWTAAGLALLLTASLTACGKGNGQTVQTEQPDGVWVQFETTTGDVTTDSGEIALQYDYQMPTVTGIPGAEQINEAWKSDRDVFLHGSDFSVDGMKEEAADWYETYGEVAGTPYTLSTTMSVARADSKVLSFVPNFYTYTGGAHGYGAESGRTFDSQTGQTLMLADICVDEPEFREFAESYILTLSQSSQYQFDDGESVFFNDYESSISDVVEDGLWYFDEDGIVFIAQPYMLASFACGTLTFTIPYESLEGYIREEYLPEPVENTSGIGSLTMELTDGEYLVYDGEKTSDDDRHVVFTAEGDVYQLSVTTEGYYSTLDEVPNSDLWCSHLADGEQFGIWQTFPTREQLDSSQELGVASSYLPVTCRVDYTTADGAAHAAKILLDDSGELYLKQIK